MADAMASCCRRIVDDENLESTPREPGLNRTDARPRERRAFKGA
jgi:hypothetical protein